MKYVPPWLAVPMVRLRGQSLRSCASALPISLRELATATAAFVIIGCIGRLLASNSGWRRISVGSDRNNWLNYLQNDPEFRHFRALVGVFPAKKWVLSG